MCLARALVYFAKGVYVRVLFSFFAGTNIPIDLDQRIQLARVYGRVNLSSFPTVAQFGSCPCPANPSGTGSRLWYSRQANIPGCGRLELDCARVDNKTGSAILDQDNVMKAAAGDFLIHVPKSSSAHQASHEKLGRAICERASCDDKPSRY